MLGTGYSEEDANEQNVSFITFLSENMIIEAAKIVPNNSL